MFFQRPYDPLQMSHAEHNARCIEGKRMAGGYRVQYTNFSIVLCLNCFVMLLERLAEYIAIFRNPRSET